MEYSLSHVFLSLFILLYYISSLMHYIGFYYWATTTCRRN